MNSNRVDVDGVTHFTHSREVERERPLLSGFLNYRIKDGTAEPPNLLFNDDTVTESLLLGNNTNSHTLANTWDKCALEFPIVTS